MGATVVLWMRSRVGGSALVLSVLAFLAGLAAGPASAQNYSYFQGLEQRGNETLVSDGPEMLGHKVSLYTGALEFVHTDVDLPGNSNLKVALTRSYKERGRGAGWRFDSPRMAGNFASTTGWVNLNGTTNRCSSYSQPPAIGFVNAYEYWQGNHIYLPGEGQQEVLTRTGANTSAPNDGYSYPLVTRDHWQIRCLPTIQNGTGEGFVARSPSGEEYRFDWLAKGAARAVKNQSTVVQSVEHNLMATQVTDRFGNWVRYAYDPANPMRLTSITANDGRAITITYVNGNVGTVSDGTRTWTYNYDTTEGLSAVVLPDGSRWEFSLAGLRVTNVERLELGEGADCDRPGLYPDRTFTGTVKHPSGLIGTYTTRFLFHSRSNVARWCIGTTAGTTGARFPRTLVNQGLVSLTTSGPGIPASTWSYAHGGGIASWAPCNPCYDTKTVQVTDPRGFRRLHTFGVRFQSNEGQLLSIEEIDSGTVVRRTQHRYRSPAGMAYPDPPGASPQQAPDFLSLRHRPIDQTVITQQGVTFTWEAAAGSAGFDARARPLTATRSSSLGFAKTETTAYHDNTAKWTLSQVASVTDSSGLVPESHSYDATTALRTASYAFGRLTDSYTYHPTGLLNVHYDPANRGTAHTNYMRGIARTIAYPDGTSESAVVNNIGRVTSHTNAAGTTTQHTYDAMGRLASTTHPNDTGLTYHATTQVFEPVGYAEVGLAAGHWRQTTNTGNLRKVRYFDALWRERVSVTWDAANPGGTSRYVETRYDSDGRKTFASYPLRNLSSVDTAIAGMAWSHDALGRVTQQREDSELGVLTTTTEYLGNFQKRVTNPRGHATTFAYQAFDSPSEDAITTVWAPEGSTLSIVRDVFGKPRSITRSGMYGGSIVSATRSYVYDASQRLCKTIEPETGATVQAYDSANNIAWRASGLALPSTSSCDQSSAPDARKLTYGYDTRNRLTSTTYGDGSPGIGRNYTADGLPNQVWSGASTWAYTYNGRRLMTSETLTLSGTMYRFIWGIEAHGNVASLTYPDGAVVSFSPDAMGRPTQASGFASGVGYHPNGLISGYTLANGIAHSSTQTTRGLPSVWRDAGVVQDAYAYDAAANVTAITDQQEGLSSRSMGYDGLDRLTAANGIWGSGSFGYDALDNLRTSVVGSRSAVASIDGANRLSALTVNGAVQGYGYDANGNLTLRGSQGFAFDIGNRLTSAAGKASYAYDGHGRRTYVAYTDGSWKVQVYSQAGKLLWSQHSSQGATRHVYLGDRLVAEASSAGVSYSHTDALGSPVARTNGSAQVTSRTRYEPYGATAAGTNPAGIGFTGHVNDADTGLVYMQQRYYDPIAGRFLSVDPVTTNAKTGDFFGRYHYANNNPYKFVDPDGRAGALAACAAGPVGCAVGVVVTIAVGAKAISDTAKILQNSSSGSSDAGSGQQATSPPPGTQGSSQGCIYCVSGENTSSGRDYVGSTDNMGQRAKDTSDGRNRQGAEVVGTYDKGDKQGRRNAEQQAINDRGGKDKLDNKRNEVAPKDWGDRGIKPPEKSN